MEKRRVTPPPERQKQQPSTGEKKQKPSPLKEGLVRTGEIVIVTGLLLALTARGLLTKHDGGPADESDEEPDLKAAAQTQADIAAALAAALEADRNED